MLLPDLSRLSLGSPRDSKPHESLETGMSSRETRMFKMKLKEQSEREGRIKQLEDHLQLYRNEDRKMADSIADQLRESDGKPDDVAQKIIDAFNEQRGKMREVMMPVSDELRQLYEGLSTYNKELKEWYRDNAYREKVNRRNHPEREGENDERVRLKENPRTLAYIANLRAEYERKAGFEPGDLPEREPPMTLEEIKEKQQIAKVTARSKRYQARSRRVADDEAWNQAFEDAWDTEATASGLKKGTAHVASHKILPRSLSKIPVSAETGMMMTPGEIAAWQAYERDGKREVQELFDEAERRKKVLHDYDDAHRLHGELYNPRWKSKLVDEWKNAHDAYLSAFETYNREMKRGYEAKLQHDKAVQQAEELQRQQMQQDMLERTKAADRIVQMSQEARRRDSNAAAALRDFGNQGREGQYMTPERPSMTPEYYQDRVEQLKEEQRNQSNKKLGEEQFHKDRAELERNFYSGGALRRQHSGDM